MEKRNFSVADWAIECWESKINKKIEKEIISRDMSECYSMDAQHVFKLQGGGYLLVTESGCSCYSSDDADLTEYKTKKEAMAAFDELKRE